METDNRLKDGAEEKLDYKLEKEWVRGTAFVKASGYGSEAAYKRAMAERGRFTYHYHLCSLSKEALQSQIKELEQMLTAKGLRLDRFGVSVDGAMGLPEGIRKEHRKADGVFLEEQEDWDLLGSSAMMQPHLGDHMIGSPASYENVKHALRAGVTTIGNLSQYFGWDYPEYRDVEARTESTVQAIHLMAEHRDEGCMIHSNLDDGYADAAGDLGIMIGCALLEKYIAEELLHAKVAHSFGDLFHSPWKRLVFLSALQKIHKGNLVGSMIFTNKLGRNRADISLNTAHLVTSLLYDMAGQAIYRTGHAITVMANQGLVSDVSSEEIVAALELARELESYVPAVVDTIDVRGIDKKAEEMVERGEHFSDAVLTHLAKTVDIRNPYEVMLAIKRVGMKTLAQRFAPSGQPGTILSDYQIFHGDK